MSNEPMTAKQWRDWVMFVMVDAPSLPQSATDAEVQKCVCEQWDVMARYLKAAEALMDEHTRTMLLKSSEGTS